MVEDVEDLSNTPFIRDINPRYIENYLFKGSEMFHDSQLKIPDIPCYSNLYDPDVDFHCDDDLILLDEEDTQQQISIIQSCGNIPEESIDETYDRLGQRPIDVFPVPIIRRNLINVIYENDKNGLTEK